MPITISTCRRVRRLCLSLVLALSACWLAGCDSDPIGFALSLQPFFTDSDLQSDPLLVGSWTDAEDGLTFTFEPPRGKQYKLVVKETEDGNTSSTEFEAHLLRLGGYWFIDFLPKPGQSGGTFYQVHMIRAHSVAQIDLTRDSLRMTFLEAAWLQKKIDANALNTCYQGAAGALLLTGPSEEVRDVADQAAHEPGGFADEITFNREEVQP